MIGIYALTWEQTDKLYIGQSQNIENRYKEHIKTLARKAVTYNTKLQDTYNMYGTPSLLVLQECSLLDLDANEVSWINEFDSINTGLNIAVGGNSITRGNIGPSSKFTKTSILKAFSLLYRTLDTLPTISKRSGISTNMLTHISTGACHVWLQEAYPNQYSIMIDNIKKRAKHNQIGNKYNEIKTYPPIIGPDGVIHTIDNVRAFCISREDLGLSGYSNLYAVMLGKRDVHKGYRLLDKTINTTTNSLRPSIVDPEGNVFENIHNITEFCRDNSLLKDNARVASRGISSLMRRERKSYKGFTLY